MKKRRNRFEDEHEEHISESWLIPYADILTLLLALFIVLFASSNIDKAKYESIMESFKSEFTGTKIDSKKAGLSVEPPGKQTVKPPPVKEEEKDPALSKEEIELNNLMAKLNKYIVDNHLQTVISLNDTKRGVEISLKDVILFDTGKANLKDNSKKMLNAFVGLINTVSNPVSIEGHTDNVPIKTAEFASNWELSSERAVSVLHYFELKKIAKHRLQFVGYGEYKPLFPNDTVAHKQENRRVNIIILRKN